MAVLMNASVLASVEGIDEDVVELAVLVVVDDGTTLVSSVSRNKRLGSE